MVWAYDEKGKDVSRNIGVQDVSAREEKKGRPKGDIWTW